MLCLMARRMLILLWGAGAGLYPLFSYAMGLGDLQVESRLNQPLRARIEVSDVSDDEWRVLRARLAPEISQGDGLLRQGLLESMTFKTVEDENHRRFIEVRSAEVFTEPLFDLSIDVSGASFDVTRNYTVFLDPPGPNDDLPGARGPALVSQPGAAVPRREPDVVIHNSHKKAPAASSAAPTASVPEGNASTASYTVTKSDTLEKIARRFGGGTATRRNQFMDWVFQHNPTAFYGDMNHLRAGVRLALPESAAAASAGTVASAGTPAAASIPATASTAPQAPAGGQVAKTQLQGELTDLQQELTGLQKMIAQQDAQIASLKEQIATRETQSPAPASRAPVDDSPPMRSRESDDQPDAGKSTAALAQADQAQSPSPAQPASAAESAPDQAPQPTTPPGIWTRYHLKTSVYYWIAGILVLAGLLAYLVVYIRRRMEEANPRVHLRYEIGPTYQRPAEPAEPQPPLSETMPMIRPPGSGGAAAKLSAARQRPEAEDDAELEHEELPEEPQSGLDTWRTQTALLEQDILSETDVLPFVLDTHNQLKALDEELLDPAELSQESREIAAGSTTGNRPEMLSTAPTERLPRMAAEEVAEQAAKEQAAREQAERSANNKEIVKALESSLDYHPDRVDIQLKLLEIYHHEALDNRENFHSMLRKLSDLKNLSPAQRVHVEMLQRTLHDGDSSFVTEEEI